MFDAEAVKQNGILGSWQAGEQHYLTQKKQLQQIGALESWPEGEQEEGGRKGEQSRGV